MTTLPGLASKGEKGKSKYQSLDINSLYRSSRGESIETHQQKNTLPRKHGMQILGRVPNARRPPANLPSLKSEHSGSDAAVSLVPSGGPGWGKQDAPSTLTTTSSPATTTCTTASASATATSVSTATAHQAAIAIPVTSPVANKQPQIQSSSVAQPAATADKLWSAVMAGPDLLGQPPPYQSPQFQHEFPSLAGDGATTAVTQRGGTDVQYGPGPSLRPQTEGSWMQGGSRSASGAAQAVETGQGTAKGNSAQLAVPPQLLVPAGQTPVAQPNQHMPPPQFRGLLPPFMCRGNFPPNGHGSSNFQAMTNPLSGRGRFPGPAAPVAQENRVPVRSAPPPEVEEVGHRPIIREEELNRMDDMTRDVGWASHDDIDYNQKLAFSDDELPIDREKEKDREISQHKEMHIQKKDIEKTEQENRAPAQNRGWNPPRSGPQSTAPQQGRNQNARRVEDEEIWEQRRRQQSEEVAIAVERAKLRKEEEEKRYLETKQAAAKKLQELEDKIKEKKGIENRETEEGQGTINPSTVPPQPITPVPIPVPEWERDRETRERERSRTPNDTGDNKQQNQTQTHRDADFRQLTQIEGRSFVTKNNNRNAEREISRDRDCRERDRDIRERDGPNFSRHFQTNLPPRFQKQQAERQNNAGSYHRSGNAGSPQPQQINTPAMTVPFAQQYDPRWVQNNSSFTAKANINSNVRNNRKDESFEKERDEERGNRDMRRDRHTPDTERDRQYSESGRRVSNEGRYYDDYRSYRKEGNQDYEYKRDRDDEKWDKERDRHYDDRKEDLKKSQVQQDPFDTHEMNRQDSGEWRRDKYSKESSEERNIERQREDISQRPDSRDSRISKESLKDCSEYTGNWADSPFEPTFEDKKKDTYREERRQVPGPITKEKIEADDQKSEKRHLTQLKRTTHMDVVSLKLEKKNEDIPDKKIDDVWMKKKESVSDRNENDGPKAWADAMSPIGTGAEHKFMEALEKGHKKSTSGDSINKPDLKQDIKKMDKDICETKEKEDKQNQGVSRGRNDMRSGHRSGWGGSGNYAVYHASWSKRSDGRSSRGSQRSSGHRPHSSRSGDWQHASESELSGDESISVSTESGKEERNNRHNQSQRSPKTIKKSEKDEKNKDVKQEKNICSDRDRKFDKRPYDQPGRSRESYVPCGEPTRHGRGGFRGSRSVVPSKRIDGYGIPPSKSPFGNHDDKDKKLSGDEIGGEVISSDEKTKMNQQALSAGIIGSARNKIDNPPSRTQGKTDTEKRDRSHGRAHSGSRRQKSKSNKIHVSDAGEEVWETTSENSDTEGERKDKGRRKQSRNNQNNFTQTQTGSARQTPPTNINSSSNQNHRSVSNQGSRNTAEKRNAAFPGNRSELQNNAIRQNSSSNLRTNTNANPKAGKDKMNKDEIKNDGNVFTAAIENVKASKDIKIERADSGENPNAEEVNSDEKTFDTDGFQEVRSKKNVKERQKVEEKTISRSGNKLDKESTGSRGQKFKGNSASMQLTPQQIANIPPLLGTPVNPPSMMNTGNNKSTFERPRQNTLAPRFAKQRESRMQKAQMQSMCDVNEMNKINQNVSMYGINKDGSNVGQVPVVNAWDKPITSQLRNNVEAEALLAMGVDNCTEIEPAQQSSTSSQRSSPNNEKMLGKGAQVQDKAILDGTTPLMNTIIFENTNYKSAPVNANTDLAVKAKFNNHLKNQQRPDKGRGNKMEDVEMENTVMSGFNKPMADMLNKGETKPEPIQMPLSFNKAEDNADMKLDFTFDSDLTQLTDDKSSKSLSLPRSMHAMTSAQSTVSPSTADLNFKIASVKKVWENMPTVLEHTVGQDDSVTNSAGSFATSFGPDHNTLDHSTAFSKGTDQPDDNHEGYSPSPNQLCTSNNTTNVCKVKPTQQLAGTGQAVHSVSSHHTATQQHPGSTNQHSGMVSQNLIGHPLSPPPMPVLGASVGLGQPPQQFASNQHINYQPNLSGSAQYGGMSAIPSPPAVLFNSTQQMPTQGGLYGPFQIDQTQVLNTQGRSQFSQYPNPYGLGQTASSPYNAQSMYLQTAPHPPPSAQPPPDLYQSLSSYRMAPTGPFGQSQQLTNNPSTVLISSTSNSLMSATVKPSTQQISAIGTKAGTVGQAYQQQSQQGQQLYIPYDPALQANYLSGTGVLQRGPTGPVQNNVVPGLQPSSSFYSGSAGAQTGFYQQPANSTLQSAQLHQHQTSFGLQGNVFGTHNQSHASAAGLQSFGSQFLSSPMQIAAAAALTAQQQYRSPNLPNPNYLKGGSTQHMMDQSGRSQQLKSPGANQQDVLASVFNSAPQIPSPKSRQNCKQPPPQSSPTQHKYVSPYQAVNSQQSAQIPPTRYPTPIQRPVNFQPNLNSSLQGSGNVGQRHRPSHNQNSRGPQQRQYYGGQGGGIQASQSDKADDSKLIENGSTIAISVSNSSVISSSNGVTKSTVGNNSTNQNAEMTKETGSKDETISNKE